MKSVVVAVTALGLAAAISAEPAYRVRLETDVAVPMRDGVVLRADVLRPDAPGRFPALLYRTPYGKQTEWRDDGFALRAVREGYVVVSQDVRGRYASGGVFDPYRQESEDGFDTVEWVAALPYVDGNVGMTGLSYPGAVQWLAAMAQPPHLKAIAPSMCFSTGRRFFYFGGAFDLSWIPWFYLNIAPDVRGRLGVAGPTTEAEAAAAWEIRGDDWLRFLPLDRLPALKGAAPSYYEWLEHPDDGPFWDFADVRSHYGEIAIPALNLSGWHDEGYGPMGATENFRGTRANGSRLVIGPWTHGTPRLTKTRVGELDFGVNAGLDYQALLLRWFDFWLKGEKNGLDEEPPVAIFVMGDNAWREEEDWPLERARQTSYYLHASGRLSPEPPAGDDPPSRYDYDPLHPVIDRNGGVQGPYDQSPLDARRDVLVFETGPLSADLEVTGPIEAELFVASSAVDTDFVVRLLDVYPDGRAFNLMSPTVEVERARYRNGETHPELLVPGEVVRLSFDNLITSNLFRAGHRLRVQVTSSLFPHFDRNLNTGAPPGHGDEAVIAHQEVHHSARYPSRLVLPVVPR
jgi:putative CocE/NonD family hydrolase